MLGLQCRCCRCSATSRLYAHTLKLLAVSANVFFPPAQTNCAPLGADMAALDPPDYPAVITGCFPAMTTVGRKRKRKTVLFAGAQTTPDYLADCGAHSSSYSSLLSFANQLRATWS